MKMKRAARLGVLLGLAVVIIAGATLAAGQGSNLLVNPGFEPPFNSAAGEPVRMVAQGWQPWHVPSQPGDSFSQNIQPEYLSASDTANSLGVPRIHGGSDAQQVFTFFATFTGGVYQQVVGVTPGNSYQFSAFVYTWSTSFDNVNASETPGNVTVQVGIDPTGGTDGQSANIIWSPSGTPQYDSWVQYTVSAAPTGSSLTVFVRAQPQDPVKNNVIYIDDAQLSTGGGTAPIATTQQPSSVPATTAAAPSNTPTLVATVIPSETPIPSDTPVPTQTFTPSPMPTIDNTLFPGRYVYTVQSGDTVAAIAAAFNSSVDAIISANGLGPNGLIFVGQQLVVPVGLPFTPPPQPTGAPPTAVVITSTTAAPAPTVAPPQPPQVNTTTYVVRPGDTLFWIAVRHNTTVNHLATLNNISNPNLIFAGQRLLVPVNTAQAVPTAVVIPTIDGVTAQEVRTYTVQPGDNLYNISLRFNVPLANIISANGIVNSNRIYIGQTLIIP
ncbi:MAG: LysM peptidoglycan-binding domain-containing protein [Anaerolineae bacterium]|nr:LysM peptidoglycan-binding domain-containing protein [Anaerolineae bacterium]